MERHRRVVKEAAAALVREHGAQFALAVPRGAAARLGEQYLNQWREGLPVAVAEGAAWEALAHADVSLLASGTVTVEAALLGAPMVTFYRVSPLTYWAGRPLVNVPHYSMVNLVAGRRVVPEYIQNGCTARALAAEAGRLLTDAEARGRQMEGLREVAASLAAGEGPFERSAALIAKEMERGSRRP
jgi:lipid-A-disaccharide synthase